ncbi:MAG: hypothetical protein K6D38_09655 [Pseudobutyrivibrio sp.]|nr:hypothetical protein [Pseudobutyrivibrio sp.]
MPMTDYDTAVSKYLKKEIAFLKNGLDKYTALAKAITENQGIPDLYRYDYYRLNKLIKISNQWKRNWANFDVRKKILREIKEIRSVINQALGSPEVGINIHDVLLNKMHDALNAYRQVIDSDKELKGSINKKELNKVIANYEHELEETDAKILTILDSKFELKSLQDTIAREGRLPKMLHGHYQLIIDKTRHAYELLMSMPKTWDDILRENDIFIKAIMRGEQLVKIRIDDNEIRSARARGRLLK